MNSYYRWVIVAAGAFMGCIAIGSIFSLPVFLQPISQATGWSRTTTAMTLAFITMGVASFGWGMAMDRFGPRPVLLAGSSLSASASSWPAEPPPSENSRSSTACWRGRRRRNLRAADGDRHRMVRQTPQPRGFLVSAGMGVAPMTVRRSPPDSSHPTTGVSPNCRSASPPGLLCCHRLLIRRSPALRRAGSAGPKPSGQRCSHRSSPSSR